MRSERGERESEICTSAVDGGIKTLLTQQSGEGGQAGVVGRLVEVLRGDAAEQRSEDQEGGSKASHLDVRGNKQSSRLGLFKAAKVA